MRQAAGCRLQALGRPSPVDGLGSGNEFCWLVTSDKSRSHSLTMKARTQRLLVGLVFILALCCACSRTIANPRDANEKTVAVPQFAIAVKLSRNAEQRLRSVGEGIKMLAMFDGDPLPGQGKYSPPMRDVYLGSVEKVVDETKVVRFDEVRVPQKDFNRLADKNFYVTINTFTARTVIKDNLLDCTDPISARIDTLKGKTTEVRCWLIGEADAPTK